MDQKVENLMAELNKIIIGKKDEISLAIICLLAKGNLLIEDLPGTGKSTLSKALAKCFGLEFKNVHFTNDLLQNKNFKMLI